MTHFNKKSLIFYTVAIASVLLLFEVVTAYGETKLKAPDAINGRYRLTLAKNLPVCLKLEPLILILEQSGVYVNGFLLTADTDAQKAINSEEKPSLTGLLRNQQLSLSGSVGQSTLCNQTNASGFRPVEIKGRVEGEAIAGQIVLDSVSETAEFTAQREVPAQPSSNSTGH